MNPRSGKPKSQWSSDWTLDNSTSGSDVHVRLTMAQNEGTSVVTAWAPGLGPKTRYPRARYVMARRQGVDLKSTFVAVIEPYRQSAAVREISRLKVTGPAAEVEPVAVKVTMADGEKIVIYSSADETTRTIENVGTVAGRFACLRYRESGEQPEFQGIGVVGLQTQGRSFDMASAVLRGKLSKVDCGAATVLTDTAVPGPESLVGSIVYFANPAYSRNTVYRIASARAISGGTEFTLAERPVLGLGIVEETTASGGARKQNRARVYKAATERGQQPVL